MRGRSRMRRDRFGREPYLRIRRPQRREQIARAAGRHVRACAASNGTDGGTPIGAPSTRFKRVRGRDAWPAVRFRKWDTKKPAADLVPRGRCELFDDATMPVFCPTGQAPFRFLRIKVDGDLREANSSQAAGVSPDVSTNEPSLPALAGQE